MPSTTASEPRGTASMFEASPYGTSLWNQSATSGAVAACAESHTGRYLREMLERGRRG